MRKNPTDAEMRLWSRLRRHQMDGLHFRRQAPVGRFIVDFVCHQRRLIIEVDGGQHAVQSAKDSKRTRWLESQGFTVLRFWNHDVLRNTDGALELILHALRSLPDPESPDICPGQ